jgi:dihydroxyacid dehydratase/phosphogluconate dehydratase
LYFPGPAREGWETDVAMDARADIKDRLPSRQVTEGCDRAPHAALHQPDPANELEINRFEVAEIFKKTSCVAGLKLRGRYLAKELYDVGTIPLLMKTLLDNGHLDGDCMTVTGRTIAENLKGVKPIAITGGIVGVMGNLAPEGAVGKVAGMLQDGDIIDTDGEVPTPNAKLSASEGAERETEWQPRATNKTSGALWEYAQVGPAVDGAVTHPGGAHEKQCYADI